MYSNACLPARNNCHAIHTVDPDNTRATSPPFPMIYMCPIIPFTIAKEIFDPRPSRPQLQRQPAAVLCALCYSFRVTNSHIRSSSRVVRCTETIVAELRVGFGEGSVLFYRPPIFLGGWEDGMGLVRLVLRLFWLVMAGVFEITCLRVGRMDRLVGLEFGDLGGNRRQEVSLLECWGAREVLLWF